ncbi:MAG: hypothetical protein ACI4OJ_09685, partial [Lachnospiraceae bacterium]
EAVFFVEEILTLTALDRLKVKQKYLEFCGNSRMIREQSMDDCHRQEVLRGFLMWQTWASFWKLKRRR